MSYLYGSHRSWIRAARAALEDLEGQLLDAPPDRQDRLREQIAELRADLNQTICLDGQHIGWR